jgi:F-type H+-transporting ATPase subunit epsilon
MASNATMQVDVVSAEASIYSGEAKFVALPGESGELGILPRHTPLITRIKPGTVRIERADGGEELVFVAGGILEVQPAAVTVLADTAVRAADLDEAAAVAAKQRAEAAMENRTGDFEYATASAELAEAMAQLAAIQRLRRQAGR